jgi:hypothetical protein
MPHDLTTAILLVLIVVPWLIGMWAMVMHIVAAIVNERGNFSFGRLFVGSYLFERYNRKYFVVFLCVVAFVVSVGIITNVLLLTGRINLPLPHQKAHIFIGNPP